MSNSLLSDRIEQFIRALFDEQESSSILLQRKEIAEALSCAPSQVTYVINTRFSDENGFHVESRRGSGGYIKISSAPLEATEECRSRAERTPSSIFEHDLDNYFRLLADYDMISDQEYKLMQSLMQTMMEFCPPDDRKKATKTVIRKLDWIMKGE